MTKECLGNLRKHEGCLGEFWSDSKNGTNRSCARSTAMEDGTTLGCDF